MRAFESVREPFAFAIHSEWVDEAAFEVHAQLPVEGLRSRQIGAKRGERRKPSVLPFRCKTGVLA
jgi:hypothetical protein